MPELPEVETVKLGLEKLVVGKRVARVSYNWPKGFPNTPADVDQFLVGATITAVRRRAKVLLIDLNTDYSLMIHLKMTGQLVFVQQKQESKEDREERGDSAGSSNTLNSNSNLTTQNSETNEVRFGAGHPSDSLINKLPDKSTRVIFCLHSPFRKDSGLGANTRKQRSAQVDVETPLRQSTADSDNEISQEQWQRFGLSPKVGHCDSCLFFNDQRKFGWVKLLPTEQIKNDPFMQKVGPEPLSKSFTATVFIPRIRKRANSSIKAALLDQTVLAGIGNIYADESLFGAQIHPAVVVKNLNDADLTRLLTEIKSVLRLAIKKGGSSDKNYVNAEGRKGSYIDFAKVFRREGLPCVVCGAQIEKSRIAGRGTHTCPSCQSKTK
ncbi:TPA: hypothetical protein EYO12_04270 [Candidatus Saccharibacteria bacterium]|nr:hypothetical protein [Candidatus Saccharibacteria bacterium]HIO87749.1 hypothetical protein [Candidatus Saccharibacteria bacterium]